MPRALATGLLALAALGVSLALAEAALRIAAPRYAYAADARHRGDSVRIWSREPLRAYTREHPDTGRSHTVLHNNLALRQHRDIAEQAAPGELRVGLFGDSFTDNLKVPVAYSLSEVLDFLLNQHGPAVTVLNFGLAGYGTGQSYLRYRDSPAARDLDEVVYVFCANDVRNVYETALFSLQETGELVQNAPPPGNALIAMLSRLYLTYLVVDARNRLVGLAAGDAPESPRAFDETRREERAAARATRTKDDVAGRIHVGLYRGEASAALETYTNLVSALVARWREEANAEGAGFQVVLLPRRVEHDQAALFEDSRVTDLYPAFENYRLPEGFWRFENDGHWNEIGNQFAAVHLYRVLAPSLGLVPMTDAEIRRALGRYYTALETGEARTSDRWRDPARADPAAEAALRARYLGLESADWATP